MTHICHSVLLSDRIDVLVVGAGGTGSLLCTDLARLQMALDALGHPGGMQVTVCDGDTVSHANVGRQTFYDADIGKNKASIVVNRINACYGLGWEAIPEYLDKQGVGAYDIVISCVDSRAARRTILESFNKQAPRYWLDMGNKAHFGQCVLGEPLSKNVTDWDARLPIVTELYSELLDETIEEDDAPSCSLAEALKKQGLYINRMMATHGLQMLETLITQGQIDYNAVFVDLKRAKTNNLPVSKEAWSHMGYYSKGVGKRPQ